VLIAGGAVATLLLLRGREDAKPIDPFVDLKLSAPATFGSLVVVTDGTVPAKTVADTYRGEHELAVKRIVDGLANRGMEPATLVEKHYELYAVPQAALCIKNAYLGDEVVPKDCESAPFAYTAGWRNSPPPRPERLLLVSSKLDVAVKKAARDMLCASLPDESERSRLICDLAREQEPVAPAKDEPKPAPGDPTPKPKPGKPRK
jgi:hypothetical protein